MISVFTPVHAGSVAYLSEAHQSLLRQTHQDWEWIITPNGGASLKDNRLRFDDERIRVTQLTNDPGPHNKIGRLKSQSCALCSGDILVELDADDMLTPDCLQEIHDAFSNPEIQFAYSNSAQFDKDWKPHFYSPYWGWVNRPFTYEGHELVESVAWPPTVHSMRRIEWCPNHVRAFRRSAYNKIGGHNAGLTSGDDHELCCRFYVEFGMNGFKHIDKCLYLYRVHENTCNKFNNIVQEQVAKNYLKFIYPMVERWATDNQLTMMDLGGAINPKPGYGVLDLNSEPSVDLNLHWPLSEASVGVLNARHILEHLTDPIHFFNESYRVLAPGGWLMLEFPSATGKGAFRDPSHKSFLVDQSIWYFTDRAYARFIDFKGRFQLARMEEWLMGEQCPVVTTELIALKDGYERPCGEVKI